MTPPRGSVRREVRIACPPADVWAIVGDPQRLPEWFPGIVELHGRRPTRVVTSWHRAPMPEQIITIDHLQRRSSTASRLLCSANTSPPSMSTTSMTARVSSCTASTPTPRPWHSSSAVPPATPSATSAVDQGAPLMGRKILFVTTDQQRYDTLGCNGGTLGEPRCRRTCGDGYPLRAGATRSPSSACRRGRPSHRPIPDDPRRMDERRAAANRSPLCCRQFHDAGYRTASSARPISSRILDPFLRFTENALAVPAPCRPAATTGDSSISSSPPTVPPGHCTTPAGCL